MRRPHASVSALVALVLIAALDFAILRYFPRNDRAWLDLFALPMANILMFASCRDRSRRRRGERSPFLLGFQRLGWAAVLSYLVWCRVRPQETSMALALASEWVHWTALNNLDFDVMKGLDPTFGLAWRISKGAQGAAVAAVVTAVMLLVASCGGIIFRRRARAAGNAGDAA